MSGNLFTRLYNQDIAPDGFPDETEDYAEPEPTESHSWLSEPAPPGAEDALSLANDELDPGDDQLLFT